MQVCSPPYKSVRLQGSDFKEDGQKILASFHDWVQNGASGAEGWILEKENHEGWRVSIDEGEGKRGWCLLRASLHDPLLVLNAESDVRGGEHVLPPAWCWTCVQALFCWCQAMMCAGGKQCSDATGSACGSSPCWRHAMVYACGEKHLHAEEVRS